MPVRCQVAFGSASIWISTSGLSAFAAVTPIPRNSIAVLPFLNLTQGIKEDKEFADGITEELSDKLSKVPGLRVPSPTSSFYFKNKKVPRGRCRKSVRGSVCA